MNTENESEVVRMPLWKACLDNMRSAGIAYNQTFTAEFFEKELRCKRDVMQFALSVSEIRRELLADGFYLSGRGQGGNSFVILPPESNADVMRSYSVKAADALKRGVILGTNTRLDTLNESERRRHEGILERMAVKQALIQRSGQVATILRKSKPSLLP